MSKQALSVSSGPMKKGVLSICLVMHIPPVAQSLLVSLTITQQEVCHNLPLCGVLHYFGGSCLLARSLTGMRLGSLREHCANRKADPPPGGDGNLITPTNRLDLAASYLSQIPCAEPHQAHFVTLGDVLAHNLGEGFDDLAGLFQIQTSLSSNLVDQLVFADNGMTLFG